MILVINGSPNKDSKTMTVTDYLLNILNDTTLKLNTYELNINSCDDCGYCHYKDGCKHEDDMTKIYALLEEIDTLIISSPIYFGHFTDQTMKLINRFQRFFSEKWIKKSNKIPTIQNLYIVSTAAHGNEMFTGIKITNDILVNLFNVINNHLFTIPYSETESVLSDEIKNTIKNEVA